MTYATFRGGIHPPGKKKLSGQKSITPLKPPERVVIPFSQHLGAPCTSLVSVNQEVKKGEKIGEAGGFVSAPVHASVSGKVVAVGEFPNVMGRMIPAAVIENNMHEEWTILKDDPDYMALSPEVLREKIKEAGIVGMGGAAFPTVVKLSPPKEKLVDTVILNGSECEPYLTGDYRLMIERPAEIIEGLRIIMKTLRVERGFVGIEDNKPDAVRSMQQAAEGYGNIEVRELQTKYPEGAEKMLIKVLTGRAVPPRALPMDVRVVVQNISTSFAIFEAVRYGKPLIERVVTVSGEGISNPQNLQVSIGTLVSNLINECGGLEHDSAKIIAGGPMMGFALFSLDVPVTKGTSGIIVMKEADVVHADDFGPCIRCGRCIDACPMGLMPSMLSIYSEKGFFEDAKEYNLFDCFECGSCAFVCPSKRPIVHQVRVAKTMVKP
jgi:electron transport complex protein RnfC